MYKVDHISKINSILFYHHFVEIWICRLPKIITWEIRGDSIGALKSKKCWDEMVIIGHIWVDQAGSEQTEAGESALPAEESPSAGTGRAQTLWNLQENIIDFIMGAGGETSLYLPWS